MEIVNNFIPWPILPLGNRPTTQKPCEDRVSTCSQYGKDMCKTYAGWASDNCPKYCNICGKK